MRTTRPQMFMEMAQAAAKRSTCMRLNVGAIIVQDRSVVSIGYNGPPPGAPHCGGNDCPGKQHCKETIHAEVNAFNHLRSFNEGSLMDLYVTDSPCESCLTQLGSTGLIGRIFFGTPYRITDHLTANLWNIPIYRVLPAGYIVDWETKELVDVET